MRHIARVIVKYAPNLMTSKTFGNAPTMCVFLKNSVGSHIYYILSDMAEFFSPTLRATILLYPPIAVLIVDTMHTVASKVE